MTGWTAVRNGAFIPAAELQLPASDAGFVLGVTVAEQIRTFGGELFCLDAHLDRLARSLQIIDLTPSASRADLVDWAQQLVRANHRLLPSGSDLGLCIFVTPGDYPTMVRISRGPVVGMHVYPLPFDQWAGKYQTGQRLTVTRTRQVPENCWPAELKCRSRMHYYLADQEARRADPESRALLLDQDGFVCEASTANVAIFVEGEGIVAPRQEKTLPGISVATLADLARELELPVRYRDLTVAEVAAAQEVMLCSTSICVLPVSHLDGQPIGDGQPGPVFGRLLSAWSERVGLDIAAQARRFGQPD